jgi:hypothetical protein
MSGVHKSSLSRDVISEMSEQDLRRLLGSYKGQINQRGIKNLNTQLLEVDYCYLQREMQLRDKKSFN